MDLRDSLEFLKNEFSTPVYRDYMGNEYLVDRDSCNYTAIIPPVFYANTLVLNGLQSLVTMIKEEGSRLYESLYVTINGPTRIDAYGPLDDRGGRSTVYMAKACNVIGFNWGRKDIQQAIIALRSQFDRNDGIDYILDVLSKVTLKSEAKTEDNGITQTMTGQTGVVLKAPDLPIKPIVTLKPYRTFLEVNQPESEFLFRLDGSGSDISVELKEADGNMWQISAMESIKEYLTKELEGIPNVHVAM